MQAQLAVNPQNRLPHSKIKHFIDSVYVLYHDTHPTNVVGFFSVDLCVRVFVSDAADVAADAGDTGIAAAQAPVM